MIENIKMIHKDKFDEEFVGTIIRKRANFEINP
jgi:hypothetical protein